MIIDEIWFYVAIAALLIIAVFLFFLQSRYQRDAFELSQDLTKAQADLSQMNQKFEQLAVEKNQIEQWAIQYKTQAQAGIERISEKEAQINRLHGKIEEAEQQEQQLERYINELKERIGAFQAKSESLEEQLQFNQNALSHKERESQSLSAQLSQTQNELTELRTSLSEKQANFEAQQRNFIEVKQQLNVEFQHLAQQILEEKTKSFTASNQSSLDALLKPFKEQIEGFQKRVNEVHSESLKGTASLEAELKRVLQIGVSMSEEAQNLTNALKGNNKIAGNWGEVQLESALQAAGLLAGEHYVAQESFRDQEGKRFAPDFVVHLPDQKHLIIDSKVSLLAYDQAVRSEENFAIAQALDEHCKSLRSHIDGLSKKNYSSLQGVKSPDFVLMFVPIEPAYIEAMKHDPQLFNYGYERNVILVSYTTLMPILRTVANLWRIERGNAEAREISEKAGEIYNQVCSVADRLAKLGNTLNTVNNQYNQTVTSLVGRQGLVGKVERFQQLSAKASQTMPAVEMLTNDFDTNKLTLIAEKIEDSNAANNEERH
ncbi:DNA recombination protein RmuC [Actinobacillus pleuropneumoniae]|uniref:DNA recombination protein RmuC n=1 Tax=Actinobacillus pleuropneumoniae TaxID=715 RepID=A0A9Q4DIX3_ACTPL|nr:DNA recombination protein RmuC [Actinobacillus pleuropneumoniae]MCL7720961.1 DNA recombination protein RmuC [Actinobacillus pleuropneumoniae]MCL7726561.1 DNA recombination protein RmuC [Actinobacillus pleuropneumoniae]MCL7729065.1 DNA recombination protein RmuC [Actinobacillus pleuropneumoniae]MCY6368071.1 DNA recombination protein RmuC [Actinobacillus pleuropneumoniae]MCY6384940.1 DNA recombination protein RmuC [Actinobacillus pleuropneumoniae]